MWGRVGKWALEAVLKVGIGRASVCDAIERVPDCGRNPLGVGAVVRRREW